MKFTLLIIGNLLSIFVTYAQYPVGHTTITFNDPSRTRDIETELYYPAITAGEDVSIASGSFPVLVFGHGFVMAWDSYNNFWEEFVPKGYIMVFPRTEGSTSPDHAEFGLDIAFLVDQMQDENTNASSIFYSAVANRTAVMGHSMGGGSSFLAAEANTNITTLVNFAAAETTPSSTAAAAGITIPALMFSGSEDCVAPPADHQIPMYNALGSSCKTLISITNGGHCYFANYNFNCTFGESFCLPVVPLSREEQQLTTNDFLILWLDFQLKDNQVAFDVFIDSLASSPRITYMMDCSSSTQVIDEKYGLKVFPNPVQNYFIIETSKKIIKTELINSTGQKTIINSSDNKYDISFLNKGLYFVKIHTSETVFFRTIVKMQ